ncbi:cysteine synthase [Biscogniauxia marginata]|nr:cysteine synthase [Biscogniauxia marginata]
MESMTQSRAMSQNLNVFRGPDSIVKYFDPDENLPLPLVEVPDTLNPLRADGVRIYAKMLTALPAQNVKSLPVLNMLRLDPSAQNKSIVEASSGSTVLSLAIISRVLWGNEDVTAHVTNKKSLAQLRLLRFFGLKISLYGGLAQQEPTDPRGIMCRLRRLVDENPQVCYPGQYDNPNNWKAHTQWTGPQILRQLPEVNVFCTTVGTGGCITGTGCFLKEQKPSIKVVGVFNVFSDPTPGPRHFQGFCTCGFPWKDTVDALEEVLSVDSYRMSMRLSREGLICGPSSGEALCGLMKYLNSIEAAGELRGLADPTTGEINCVFTCSDLPYQYIDGYFQRLGEEEFPRIENEILLDCDQYRYDERWEMQPEEATRLIVAAPRLDNQHISVTHNDKGEERREIVSTNNTRNKGSLIVIDLRAPEDYLISHVPQSTSLPLPGINPGIKDLFGDSGMIQAFWTRLHQLFDENSKMLCNASPVLVLCYDGEVARLATSILRARGVEAHSVLGGYTALVDVSHQ